MPAFMEKNFLSAKPLFYRLYVDAASWRFDSPRINAYEANELIGVHLRRKLTLCGHLNRRHGLGVRGMRSGRGFAVRSAVGVAVHAQRFAQLGFELAGNVFVVLQKLAGIFAALADALALVAEPGS